MIEKALQENIPSLELSPLLSGVAIVFGEQGRHLQQTGPGRTRDVRRLAVHEGEVKLHVWKSNRSWKAADGSDWRAIEQCVGVRVSSTVQLGELETLAYCKRKLIEWIDRGRERWLELKPQWEWCREVGVHPEDSDALPLSDWGMYAAEQNDKIERAFRSGETTCQIEVGIRTFQIVFAGNGFANQSDSGNRTRRLVRRNLVSAMPTSVDICDHAELDCALCQESLCQTSTMPVWELQCGHIFHQVCALPLASRGDRCPLCRGEVDWQALRK